MSAFTHPGFSGPLIGFALFASQALDAAALRSALAGEFGEAAVTVRDVPAEGDQPATSLITVTDGDSVVVVAPFDQPLPSDEALAAASPLYWDDPTPVRSHASHAVVQSWRPDDFVPDIECKKRTALLFSSVATVVLDAADGVAFYYGNGGATFPAQQYTGYVRACLDAGNLPTDVWVTTWPELAEAGHVSAVTLGLPVFAHADLSVHNSEHTGSEVFFMLKNLVGHLIASGDHLDPGDTVGYGEDGAVLTVHEPGDDHPGVLRLVF